MASSDMFNQLVVGLAQYFGRRPSNEAAPIPWLLQQSLNELALVSKEDFPKTLSGLWRIAANNSVQSWYPGELPGDFDPDARLLEHRNLSYEVIEYLDNLAEEADANLEITSVPAALNLLLHNRRVRLLRDRLQTLFMTDPIGAQREYVQLRRFLIENPLTTITDIEATFF